MEGKVFFPLEFEYVPEDGPLVFLAGPAKGAPLWQKRAAELIQAEAPHIHIATPRSFTKGLRVDDYTLERQATWEQVHLEYARRTGAIIFACPLPAEETPGRDYGRTTRNEMGVFQERCNVNGDKLFTWIEAGFQWEWYLRSVHENFYQTKNAQGEVTAGVVHVDSLEALCSEAVRYILDKNR